MAADRFRLTVLGTTDVHSHILDWDYFTDAPYADAAGNHVGLARISTLINQVRDDRGREATITVDNGDTIEGTPLAHYFARIAPDEQHPMALAMNAIGYDAAAVGNHEFNFGLPALESFAAQVEHPLLCANARHTATGEPAFTPYLLKRIATPAQPVTVGILGLVTPGCAIWDEANLAGRLSFDGIVEQAARTVPQMRSAGAEVVVVLCHSGAGDGSSYGDALPWPENAATALAEQVAGIDAILVGHAHVEIGERQVRNIATGRPVLLTEPLKWGMRLAVIDLDLEWSGDHWHVAGAASTLLDAADAESDPVITAAVSTQHQQVRRHVNSQIGVCAEPLSAARSRVQATAVIDLINHVQSRAVRAGLAGSEWAALPVLGVCAAYNAAAGIPAGPVTIRDVAALYNYENTVLGVLLTGAQLRDYLEHSARYYRRVTGSGPFSADQLTGAPTEQAPTGTPAYNYDIVSGLDQPLGYDLDLLRAPGDRVTRLHYGGRPVADEQQLVVAVNNYRRSGGGDYPWISSAPVLFDSLAETRQLIIDWVRDVGVIEPAGFATCAWRLVAGGEPITLRD